MEKEIRLRDHLLCILADRAKEYIEYPPPRIPAVRKIINEFNGSQKEKRDLIEELWTLWITIHYQSQGGKLWVPGEFYPDLDTYLTLKRNHPNAAKSMWEHINLKREEKKRELKEVWRQIELDTPEGKKKFNKIYIPTVKDLEYIHTVRKADFFKKPHELCKTDSRWCVPKMKHRVETELETMWYIVKHIGPRRRVKKSLNQDSVDFYIYQYLKRRYEGTHYKMVEYVKAHPELYPDES